MVNKPEEDEVRTVGTLVAVSIAVTWAFGIEAPVLSVTVPEIVPSPAVWACRVGGIAISRGRPDTKSIKAKGLSSLQWKIVFLKSMMTSLEREAVACMVPTVVVPPSGSVTVLCHLL
jgi:hypothetical protein